MRKLWLTAIFTALLSVPATTWELDAMNKQITQTNFIVGTGCSGTLISLKYRLVLTNYHCIQSYISLLEKEEVARDGTARKVKREERADVPLAQRNYTGSTLVGSVAYLATIVEHKKTSDLALLQIRATDLPYTVESKVLPAGKTVRRGEVVYIVGNPAGLDATLTVGVVSSTTRTERFGWTDSEVEYLQISGGVYFGSSGGALYNTDGFLIGVPFMLAGTPHLGGAVHYNHIRKFLTDSCYSELWNDKAEKYEVCKKKE